ncbi:MAG: hypothetical protein ABF296_02895 [Oceanococcaceae bacterium]
MNQTNASRLMDRLQCEERDVAFLDYLPDTAQKQLIDGIEHHLNSTRADVDAAVSTDTQALPGWLGWIASRLLA